MPLSVISTSHRLTHIDDLGSEVALVTECAGGGEGCHEDREELLLGGEEAGDGAESGHCNWSVARMGMRICE